MSNIFYTLITMPFQHVSHGCKQKKKSVKVLSQASREDVSVSLFDFLQETCTWTRHCDREHCHDEGTFCHCSNSASSFFASPLVTVLKHLDRTLDSHSQSDLQLKFLMNDSVHIEKSMIMLFTLDFT